MNIIPHYSDTLEIAQNAAIPNCTINYANTLTIYAQCGIHFVGMREYDLVHDFGIGSSKCQPLHAAMILFALKTSAGFRGSKHL